MRLERESKTEARRDFPPTEVRRLSTIAIAVTVLVSEIVIPTGFSATTIKAALD